jgi:hypothetical protein
MEAVPKTEVLEQPLFAIFLSNYLTFFFISPIIPTILIMIIRNIISRYRNRSSAFLNRHLKKECVWTAGALLPLPSFFAMA